MPANRNAPFRRLSWFQNIGCPVAVIKATNQQSLWHQHFTKSLNCCSPAWPAPTVLFGSLL
jgi:hypothetical protein